MNRIYTTLIEIIAASVFVIPIFCIYEKVFFHSMKRTFAYIIFGFYLTAVLALVGFPNITSININYSVNIIPFTDMVSDFTNAYLNVLLFVPFGFFLPILWSEFRNIKRAVLMGAVSTFIIETVQIFTFRATDINDIITNIIGTIIGYFTAKWITKNFTQHTALHTKIKDFYIICGTVMLIMFLLQPFVSSLLWEMVL